MKKIVYVLLAISITLFTLSGCEKQVKTRDELYLKLAEKATTYQEVYNLIKSYSEDKNEQEEFNKKLALVKGNDTVQYALLASEDLSPEVLVAIVENPRWENPHYLKVVNTLTNKIKDAELTQEQEVKIAKSGYKTAHEGLLLRDNLCCEALCYIADRKTTAINLKYCGYQSLLCQHGAREWSTEEKIRLTNTKNIDILEGMKECL